MQYNNNLENDFLNRTVIRAAQILLLVLSPGFFSSIYRAISVDGAFVVVTVQAILYLLLLLVAIPNSRLGYKTRIISIASIIIIIGLGGLIRNQNLLTGFVYIWFGLIFLSVMLNRVARYVLPTIGYIAVFIFAVSAGIETFEVGLSRFLAFVGVSLGAIYFLDAILQRSVDQRNEYAAIAEQLSEAKVELALLLESKDLQQARQDQVAKAANIAFLEYDYTTGLLDGDAQLKRRYGRSKIDGAILLSERADSFPPESLALINSEIMELSLAPVDSERTFIHDQWIDGELRTMRVTGKNILREGSLIFFGASIDITEETNVTKEAERQLAYLDLLAEAGKIGLVTYFPSTGMVKLNKEFSRRMGRDVSDALIPVSEYQKHLDPVCLERRKEHTADLLKQPYGTVQTFDESFICDNGESLYLKVSRIRLNDKGDDIFLSVSIDVTSEMVAIKEAHELADQIELFSNTGGVGMIEFFPDTRTFKCNAEVSKRLGLEHTEVERDIELFYAHQTEEIRQHFLTPLKALAQSQSGELQSFTHPFYLANGELHYMRVSRIRREVNGRVSFLGLSLDITDEVQAKDQSDKAMRSLVQEQDRQAQMYAVIGHELRTPTASLKMILDDAQQGSGQINTALFSSTIDQLLGVIDTLRTVAQPEKMGQASVNSVVLADLLNDQLQILTPIAKQSGVTLKGDFDSLASDRIDLKAQLLKQLVSNLTKNAIIHSKGSEVRIEAEAAVKEGVKSVILVVADNGVGIPAEQIQHLFSAFSRGSSDAEGTGLGLYVCREIATALGGNLTYEPGLEGGSRFVLRFDAKLSKLATDTDTDTDTDTEALRGLTVLLSEDNPTIQMLTKRMLEQKGAHPVVANNGEEALIKAKEQTFDLILSDIFMPKMNGYQFVESLRQQGIATPVIGLTAATIGEETDKMLAAGANAVLSKPVNITELTKLVASFKS